MLEIPLIATPAQQINTVLNNQDMTIAVYEKTDPLYGTNMYIDVAKDGVALITGQIVVINTPLVPANSGLAGNIYAIDLDGQDEPQTSGLGTRWLLIYAEDSEL